MPDSRGKARAGGHRRSGPARLVLLGLVLDRVVVAEVLNLRGVAGPQHGVEPTGDGDTSRVAHVDVDVGSVDDDVLGVVDHDVHVV